MPSRTTDTSVISIGQSQQQFGSQASSSSIVSSSVNNDSGTGSDCGKAKHWEAMV